MALSERVYSTKEACFVAGLPTTRFAVRLRDGHMPHIQRWLGRGKRRAFTRAQVCVLSVVEAMVEQAGLDISVALNAMDILVGPKWEATTMSAEWKHSDMSSPVFIVLKRWGSGGLQARYFRSPVTLGEIAQWGEMDTASAAPAALAVCHLTRALMQANDTMDWLADECA